MNETMNLHEYYRNHKDAINASIMDIACDLAVGRLLNAHGAPFEILLEADTAGGSGIFARRMVRCIFAQ